MVKTSEMTFEGRTLTVATEVADSDDFYYDVIVTDAGRQVTAGYYEIGCEYTVNRREVPVSDALKEALEDHLWEALKRG